jgi:hypothetical protein
MNAPSLLVLVLVQEIAELVHFLHERGWALHMTANRDHHFEFPRGLAIGEDE